MNYDYIINVLDYECDYDCNYDCVTCRPYGWVPTDDCRIECKIYRVYIKLMFKHARWGTYFDPE